MYIWIYVNEFFFFSLLCFLLFRIIHLNDIYFFNSIRFWGLGVHLKNFDINKTKLYEGKIDEEIDKRPVTPCILPDEDVKKKKKEKHT